MKKLLPIVSGAAIALAIVSCGNTKLSEEQARNNRLDDSLRVALANSDSLFSLLYDVTVGMDQITHLEQLLNAPINRKTHRHATVCVWKWKPYKKDCSNADAA